MVHSRLDHASGVFLLDLSRKLCMHFTPRLVKVHLDSSLSKQLATCWATANNPAWAHFIPFLTKCNTCSLSATVSLTTTAKAWRSGTRTILVFCLFRSPFSYTTNLILQNREIYNSAESITPERKVLTASKFILQINTTLHSSSENSITHDLSNGVIF
jgi:hypothetical protein